MAVTIMQRLNKKKSLLKKKGPACFCVYHRYLKQSLPAVVANAKAMDLHPHANPEKLQSEVDEYLRESHSNRRLFNISSGNGSPTSFKYRHDFIAAWENRERQNHSEAEQNQGCVHTAGHDRKSSRFTLDTFRM